MTSFGIPKVQVQANGLVEVFAIGVTKAIEERALTPVIGNGSVKSGLIKGVGGVALHGHFGTPGRVLSNALIIDAVEDVTQGLLGNFLNGIAIPGQAKSNGWE